MKSSLTKMMTFTIPLVKESELLTAVADRNQPVGILGHYDSAFATEFVFSPEVVRHLVEVEVRTLVQRGAGMLQQIPDMSYANAGAELYDESSAIITPSKLILKNTPLSLQELEMLKENQIVLAPFDLNNITATHVQILLQKKISALDFHLIRNKNKVSILEEIGTETLSAKARQIAFNELMLPLILTLVMNKNIRHAIETHIGILQSIICYNGVLTNADMAEKFHCPWTNILELCCNWN